MLATRLILFFLSLHTSFALPVPTISNTHNTSSPILISVLVFPFLVLAVLKYSYLKFRRVQSIHAQDKHSIQVPSIINEGCSRSYILWPRNFNIGPYLVGFLGSPDWETAIKYTLDKASRKDRENKYPFRLSSASSTAGLYSRYDDDSPDTSGGNATAVNVSTRRSRSTGSKSKSTAASASVSLFSRSPEHSITSCAAIHPSSPPCVHDSLLPVTPKSACTISSLRIRRLPDGPSSTSLMQMMAPVISSWYDESKLSSTTDASQDKSTSFSGSSNQDKSTSSSGSSSGLDGSHSTKSATPSFKTAPSSPVPPTPYIIPITGRKQIIISSPDISPLRSEHISLFEPTNIAVPSPVRLGISTPPNRTPPNRTPPSHTFLFAVQSPTRSSPSVDILPPSFGISRVPFASITRPLNVTKNAVPYRPASKLSPPPEKPRPKPVAQSHRRASGSPAIGPSPLRNSLILESVSFALTSADASSVHSGIAALPSKPAAPNPSGAGSWELSDLVKGGELDVDAVSDLLGLGFGTFVDTLSPSNSDIEEATVPGGLPAGMGWGRARETGHTELQIRQPGAPLCVIPEETDDLAQFFARTSVVPGFVPRAGAMRESSGSSVLEIDLGLMGLDRFAFGPAGEGHSVVGARDSSEDSDGEVIWEDDSSWRENLSVRDNIGTAL